MLKPFQGSKRADCGGVKESFTARAAGCTAPVTACQGWCVQPRSARGRCRWVFQQGSALQRLVPPFRPWDKACTSRNCLPSLAS